jgi:hypothetical protein
MKTRNSWIVCPSLAGAILLGTLAALPARAQNYPSLILTNSPVDYWRFLETVASPAINTITNSGSAGAAATGYALDGAITGQTGIVGHSILLTNTGQNIGYCYSRVDIPNLPALNPQPPFTIEFWMKPEAPFAPTGDSSPPTGVCPLSSLSPFPGNSSRSGYLFYVLPTNVTFRIGGEQSYSATAAATVSVSTASFTHVVGEFDGTTATIYVNGVMGPITSANRLSNPFFPNQWVPLRIGGTSLDGAEFAEPNGDYRYLSGNRGWDGWIDEVAVYNTLLSSNTILSHYTNAIHNPSAYRTNVLASNPVGYWNFDEPAYAATGAGTPAADSGSFALNGINTLGSLADQPGVPGLSSGDKSVFYSGSLGSLVLETNGGGGDPITLAAWIKPTTLGIGYAASIIVQGYDPATSYEENYLRMCDAWDWEGNGSPDVTYYDVGTFNGGSGHYSALFPVPPGDIGHWVFLVGTYDGANWNLYRNGTLVAQYADTSGPAPLTVLWSVASRTAPNPYFGFFFPGSIAEPAIFTNALDPATISNLYNSVALPPVITQAPVVPPLNYEGSSVTLSVWADGPGSLTYEWLSNSVVIAGQTATNLTLANLTASSSGPYSVIVSNQYGAATSSVVLAVMNTLPPVTLVPTNETRWLGLPFSFAPASLPNQQLSFQWFLGTNLIGGATSSAYTATTTIGSAGSYTLVISNSYGTATSAPVTLSYLTPPNGYVSTIIADQPIAYFRLDETNGTIAYDYAGGNNGIYNDVQLGQPGYSSIDPDFAVTFLGVTGSYLGGIGATTIDFPGTASEFSIEAWANGAAGQLDGAAVIAKGTGDVGGQYATEQFCIGVNNAVYRFFVCDDVGNVAEADASTGPDGVWHHLVGVCDEQGGALTFYVDGAPVASTGFGNLVSTGILPSQSPVSIGAERSGVLPTYDWAYGGTIDEVAIYNTALSASQVQAHYFASYGTNTAPFIKLQPVSITNYITLPVTLSVSAAGSFPLTYQWNHVGVGPVPGATDSTLTFPNLAYANAGTYTVGITNSVKGILSLPVTITVLAPPTATNPPAIAGLVMHLTFDNTLADATGRGNDATNEASGQPVTTNNYVQGQIGQAFSYQTYVDSTTTNANYASLGVRPDLQFGSNVSFSVSMWVQLPFGYVGNDLPFFCDVIGSTFGHPGYCFEPTFGSSSGSTAGWPGGWGFSVFDSSDAGVGVYGDKDDINDGNWHNLIYVIDRTAGATIYLDGLVAHQNRQSGTSVAGIGDIDSTNSATIGQDPTGLYNIGVGDTGIPGPQSASAYIDDLGVWRKALNPLEAASIFMAGSVNQVSFIGAPPTLSIKTLPGPQVQLIWNAGDLQSATDLRGPWTTISSNSPYMTSPLGTNVFFRAKF